MKYTRTHFQPDSQTETLNLSRRKFTTKLSPLKFSAPISGWSPSSPVHPAAPGSGVVDRRRGRSPLRRCRGSRAARNSRSAAAKQDGRAWRRWQMLSASKQRRAKQTNHISRGGHTQLRPLKPQPPPLVHSRSTLYHHRLLCHGGSTQNTYTKSKKSQ